MDPFVGLMRRYVLDYTNRQDTAVCADIMDPGYTLRMGDHVLSGRDEHYIPAAVRQFRQFPGLCLTVHEIVTNGDRLALSFSEHGASVEHDGATASWTGIGVYRWNGTQLVENYVEQDYLSRRRQLRSGRPNPVGAPAIAPWDTVAAARNQDVENLVGTWIETGLRSDRIRENDATRGPRLDDVVATIDDIFSAGSTVAFRATLHGRYAGGLLELDKRYIGARTALHATGIVHTRDGVIDSGHIVTDRLNLVRALSTSPASAG